MPPLPLPSCPLLPPCCTSHLLQELMQWCIPPPTLPATLLPAFQSAKAWLFSLPQWIE